jgi:hypothetical protein
MPTSTLSVKMPRDPFGGKTTKVQVVQIAGGHNFGE